MARCGMVCDPWQPPPTVHSCGAYENNHFSRRRDSTSVTVIESFFKSLLIFKCKQRDSIELSYFSLFLLSICTWTSIWIDIFHTSMLIKRIVSFFVFFLRGTANTCTYTLITIIMIIYMYTVHTAKWMDPEQQNRDDDEKKKQQKMFCLYSINLFILEPADISREKCFV